MPTGYTYKVGEGQITKLEDFALLCARAFGATITMRDDSLETPIPEEFEANVSYHDKALDDNKNDLDVIMAMTEEQLTEAASKEYEEQIAQQEKYQAEKKQQRDRYNAMLKEVKGWVPTDSVSDLKKFMIEQLEGSIEFDCDNRVPEPVIELTGEEWKTKKLKDLAWSIDYHAKAKSEEIGRVKERNQWIKELRDSLRAAA